MGSVKSKAPLAICAGHANLNQKEENGFGNRKMAER
jgi:hypothetical protein